MVSVKFIFCNKKQGPVEKMPQLASKQREQLVNRKCICLFVQSFIKEKHVLFD